MAEAVKLTEKPKTVVTQNDNFEALAFEKTLANLKNTQVGVQALSSWCLKNRHHHKRIITSWLNVLKRGTIFYSNLIFKESFCL